MPELVKKTLASGMPDSLVIFSASSTWLRMRYSVEVCTIPEAICRSDGLAHLGHVVPSMVVRIPPKKSR